MEASPTLEFELYLAQKLGMTLGRMRDQMSSEEFLLWGVFYARDAQRRELARLKAGG